MTSALENLLKVSKGAIASVGAQDAAGNGNIVAMRVEQAFDTLIPTKTYTPGQPVIDLGEYGNLDPCGFVIKHI